MPTHVIKDPDLRDEIQDRILQVLSDEQYWKSREMKKNPIMQDYINNWADVRTIIYALRDLNLIRNASLFTKTSGIVWQITPRGKAYVELLNKSA